MTTKSLFASLALALAATSVAGPAAAGTLFMGTDENTFDGVLPDQLGVATLSGAAFVSQNIFPTDFHINGLTDVSGQSFLYAGDPRSDAINKVSYTGTLLGTIHVTGMATGCCNEDMIWTGTQLYHAQFNNGIQLIDVTTGTILSTQAQPDVVGMAYVGGQIWISQWNGMAVGIWDPLTNAFTPEFSTPSKAGGLAYDAADSIMWVGLEGGDVVPYTLTGTALNSGFQPFGPILDTIDGLAFLGEATAPEPATLSLLGLGLAAFGFFRRRKLS